VIGKLKCPKVKGVPKKVWAQGIKVELEHTSSRRVARCIAAVHLEESPHYYVELAKMEWRLKK
jgi:hypothetical protein